MSLLDSIEAKFHAVPKLIAEGVSEAEAVAHSQVASEAETFVKAVLPLIPDGSLAEEFVKRVVEGVSWVHQALAEAHVAATDVEHVAGEAATVTEQAAKAVDPSVATGAAATSQPSSTGAAAAPAPGGASETGGPAAT